jgi:hypothetical protein
MQAGPARREKRMTRIAPGAVRLAPEEAIQRGATRWRYGKGSLRRAYWDGHRRPRASAWQLTESTAVEVTEHDRTPARATPALPELPPRPARG